MVDIATLNYLAETSQWLRIPRLEDGFFPTGGEVAPAEDSGLMNWQAKVLADRTLWLRGQIEAMTVRSALEVTVGVGGNFVTINEALEALSQAFPTHKAGGLAARVRLLSGFVMEEQVFVAGINLGWITIVGTSAITQIDRSKLTRAYGGSYPAFVAHSGGVLPVIAQLFEMSSAGVADGRDGILVSGAGSAVRINEGKGVRRAGGAGLRVASSALATAPQADFRQAGTFGIVANGCSAVDAAGAVVTSCGTHGLWASAGSTINASDAQATGCGTGGLLATLGGRVNADGARARKGAADDPADIVVNSGGIINASGAIGGTSVMANTPWSAGMIFK